MEEKLEILNYLEENINLFESVDKKVFELLSKKETSEEDKYIVMPFLKQVSEYALVASIIDEAEMNYIYDIYCDELCDIFEFCNHCSCLIEILIEDGYNNPSINNYKNSKNGIIIREKISTIMYKIMEIIALPTDTESEELDEEESSIAYMQLENTIGNLYANISKSIATIDEPIYDVLDFLIKYILFSTKTMNFSPKDILKNIKNYAIIKSRLLMLIDTSNIEVEDNNVFHSSNGEYCYPTFTFNYADSILGYIDLFNDIEESLNNDLSSQILSLIKNAKEVYHLYQSYRYSYLNNYDQEVKLLNKCKKEEK